MQVKKVPSLNAKLSDIVIGTSAAPSQLPAHNFMNGDNEFNLGSLCEEVRQLTSSVQSFEWTNQISSDDTSDTCIMLQCRRSTVP